MLISRGNFNVFVNRPISATLLAMIALFIVWQLVTFYYQSRRASSEVAA